MKGPHPYLDRHHAGRSLAQSLADKHLADADLVFAIPRGGVPVGFQIARAFRLPLDIIMLAPFRLPLPERHRNGIILTAYGPCAVDQELLEHAGARDEALKSRVDNLCAQIGRCEFHYRQGREPQPVAGKSILLADDGLTPGHDLRAAVAALRTSGARLITLAMPIASRRNLHLLGAELGLVLGVTEIHETVREPEWYQYQDPTTDEEIEACLAASIPPASTTVRPAIS